MYVKYPLSLRNVEDLLAERGIDISHETVRFWWNRFGPMFAAEIRKRRVAHMRGYPQWRWHLDEAFVKVNGKLCYLWRAVDHEGEVLEAVVTAKRDKAAALKFLKRIMKKYGRPLSVVTDGLCSYPAAMKEIGNADRREAGRRLNNRAENSHQPFRRRERAMQRFRTMKTLQKFSSVHAQVHNHFNQERHARVSTANMVSALRAFLRYAAKEGWCSNRLAASISRPRLYQQESLPYAPDWSAVQQMLADVDTDRPRDIRDRAILLLLALYGMRSGEVAALRLDQIDWAGRTLRLIRLKRRQPQIYPLLPAVAEALARYVDTVRPPSSCQEVFLCMQAPRRPLKAGSIFDVANRRFVALGIEAAHRGGHALRHACAARLLAEGLTLKEIGDHLGHRSTSATSIYAKVNMAALREVGAFDLGDVL